MSTLADPSPVVRCPAGELIDSFLKLLIWIPADLGFDPPILFFTIYRTYTNTALLIIRSCSRGRRLNVSRNSRSSNKARNYPTSSTAYPTTNDPSSCSKPQTTRISTSSSRNCQRRNVVGPSMISNIRCRVERAFGTS